MSEEPIKAVEEPTEEAVEEVEEPEIECPKCSKCGGDTQLVVFDERYKQFICQKCLTRT